MPERGGFPDGSAAGGGDAPDAAARAAAQQDPRVLFAAERTLLAWIRTGLSLMGFGFVVARFGLFLRQIAAVAAAGNAAAARPPSGASLWIGTALVALGVVSNVSAVLQHRRVLARLNRGESLFPASGGAGSALAVVLAALGAVIAVYLVVVTR